MSSHWTTAGRSADAAVPTGAPSTTSRGSSSSTTTPCSGSGSPTSSAASPTSTIVGEADDRGSAIDRALETSPDIILMDLSLPAPGGIETTQRIKRELPVHAGSSCSPRRGRGRAVRRDQGRRRGVHPQGRRPGRPGHDHPPRRRPASTSSTTRSSPSRPSPRASSRSSASWPSTARTPRRSSRRSRRARSRSSTTSPRA